MVLQRWYPEIGFRRTDDRIDRFWRGFGLGGPVSLRTAYPSLPLDVEETDDAIIVRASLPGVGPDDIEVTTENGVLTITGESKSEEEETKNGGYIIRERRAGKLHRALRLPDSVDAENAESNYEHGVLTVTLAKEPAKKAKRVEVTVS